MKVIWRTINPHRTWIAVLTNKLALVLAGLFLVHVGSFARDPESVIDSRSITGALAPPTSEYRGFTANAPSQPAEKKETRHGKGYSADRSLVEVDISVSAQSNVSLEAIRFKLDSTELYDDASRRQLEELRTSLASLAASGISFLVEGHTCPRGDTKANDKLSLDRAEYVVRYLVNGDVPAKSLRALGCGEAQADRDGVTSDDSESVLRPYRKVMIHRIAN